MAPSHRSWLPLSAILILLAIPLASCMSSKSQTFRLSFLPSTPSPAPASFEPPPVLASNLYGSETPEIVQRALTPTPAAPETDAYIYRAEARFDAGKKLYQQGDVTGARRE